MPAGTIASTSSNVGIRSPGLLPSYFSFPTSDIESAKLLEGRLRDGEFFAGDSLGVFIVKVQNVSAGAEPKVALEGVGPLFDRQLVGGDGVFRRIVRSAAMSDDELAGC